jgi:YesN/AraC family two-component response regulator
MKLTPGGRPVVLIVDDEVLVRSFLRSALEGTAQVVEAEDGDQALAILQERAGSAVDLLLVDDLLPRRSGLEVLRLTRRNWPGIPVVILTGFGSEDLAVAALRAGASDYLRKPIAAEVLRQVVATLTTASEASAPGCVTTSRRLGDGAPVAHPNIRRALAFSRAHFAEAITLTDVAREARLSRFHFCRLFHHEIGVPFHEYLHDLRVRRAKALLADRYLRVTEVAYAVGFNDLSHFDKTFRRRVGRSPTEYRASLQWT